MDKQSSKKPFFIMPEWAWAIVVGMFMLLLFLNHVIPGHAADDTPSPTVTPIPTSAIDPTDACLTIYIVGQTYMLFDEDSSTVFSYLQQYDNGLISRSELLDLAYFSRDYLPGNDNSAFFRDVKIALTQLKFQFSGFFVNLIDAWATLGAYESLYYAVSEVGVPISQDYSDYSTNRVLYMANGIYIDVPIWVWNTAIPTPTSSPTPSPTPVPVSSYVIAKFLPRGNNKAYQYYCIEFIGNTGLTDIVQPLNNNSPLNWAMTNFGVGQVWKHSVFIVNPSDCRFYFFSGGQITEYHVYGLGSFLISTDLDFIKANYPDIGTSYLNSDYGWQNSYNSTYNLSVFSVWARNFNDYPLSDVYIEAPGNWVNVSDSISSFFSDARYIWTFDQILGYAYKYGNDVNIAPSSVPQPTPDISPTPEPLPTFGESVHVILPTGSPTPTPPFTVPGGSDGSSGFDSPGSIGSGLSSGQTSGVLQAWNMYVSDNPAMLFLTSTFQSLPPELLYPLYILLFILLLLAVIRLFVHFSGG